VLDGALGVHGPGDPCEDASEDRVSLAGRSRRVRAGHGLCFIQIAELPNCATPPFPHFTKGLMVSLTERGEVMAYTVGKCSEPSGDTTLCWARSAAGPHRCGVVTFR
jgi:hypothetical protein